MLNDSNWKKKKLTALQNSENSSAFSNGALACNRAFYTESIFTGTVLKAFLHYPDFISLLQVVVGFICLSSVSATPVEWKKKESELKHL